MTRLLPRFGVYALLDFVSQLWSVLDLRHREITLKNLAIAFPDVPERHGSLLRATYRHLGYVMAENVLLITGRATVAEYAERIDSSEWPKMAHVMADSPRGVLVITGHMGNWELMSLFCKTLTEKPAAVVARQTTNPYLEENVLMPFRTSTGAQVCYKLGAIRTIMRVLRDGGFAGMLIDQKARKRDGVEIDFFGRRLMAFSSPASIQLKHNVPVVGMFLMRVGAGRYKLIVSDPVHLQPGDDVTSLTQRHQDIIAEMIRAYPEQWFWMHNRWRLPR